MRINVSTELLSDLLGNAVNILKHNKTVYIEAIGTGDGSVGTVTVTSAEGTTVASWRGEAEITTPGSIAVWGSTLKKFLEVSKKADRLVCLETFDVDNGESLRVITTRGAHEFDGYPQEVFDNVKPGRTNLDLTDLTVLSKAITVAKSTTASDLEVAGARIFLSGVHVKLVKGKFEIVGTDGKRMAWTANDIPGLKHSDIPDEGITIPGKMISVLSQMTASEPSSIRVVENSLIIENAGGSLSFALLDTAYADYGGLLKVDNRFTLDIPTKDFSMALQRSSASIGEEDRFVVATINRDDEGIHLSSFTSKESSSELLSNSGGEECEISFNASFMKKILTNVAAQTIKLHFTDVNRPVLITSDEQPNLLLLVMPCKNNKS